MIWIGFGIFILLALIIAFVVLFISIGHEQRPKIKCVTCRYCRNETLWSGRYPNGYPNRQPTYCRLQRKGLSGPSSMRCSIKNPPEEFYEDTNKTYFPEHDTNVYFSAYGDCYHSTLNCSSIKNSVHMYKLYPLDRRPCPKCWIVKDNHLIPKE